jgi:hypothetical protein
MYKDGLRDEVTLSRSPHDSECAQNKERARNVKPAWSIYIN